VTLRPLNPQKEYPRTWRQHRRTLHDLCESALCEGGSGGCLTSRYMSCKRCPIRYLSGWFPRLPSSITRHTCLTGSQAGSFYATQPSRNCSTVSGTLWISGLCGGHCADCVRVGEVRGSRVARLWACRSGQCCGYSWSMAFVPALMAPRLQAFVPIALHVLLER
jgi:hypothetical protein